MVFQPIRTERLLLRPIEPGDAHALAERRNLPQVARYQDWELPYTLERAEQAVSRLAEMDGPEDGSGWSLTVTDAARPDRIMGDVFIGIKWEGRTAEVGYTFHPDFWGRGYATEATEATIEWLFNQFGVSRIEASAHPDNPSSHRVMEACGLVFEGLTRQSFWVGQECSDDILYGMTKADWEAWNNRSRHRPERVELVPVTTDNRRTVAKLATHKSQERFVATMAINFCDALVPPVYDGRQTVPWYRAIEADGEIVGFIMATEVNDDFPQPYLWRFLIDRMHQRRGVGSAALDLFEQQCRHEGATVVEVSWAEGPGSPAPMYLARGYEPSGEIEDGEVHAVKAL